MATPVRDFLQDTETGGLAVVNGDFALVGGAAAVPQGIRIRTQLMLGECFLDQSKGVDWTDSILIKGVDPNVVRALVAVPIAATPDVTKVTGANLTLDDVTREGFISYQVDTVYSESVTGQVASP